MLKLQSKTVQTILKHIKDSDNEMTKAPYWLILDPRQNLDCNIHRLASQITGPFFNREDAQEFLDRTRYNFSKRAKVYCNSGCYSDLYTDLCSELGRV